MNLKLPHWAQLALAFAVLTVTWVTQQQASGNLTLPATVVSVLTVVNTIMGLLSPSAKRSSAPATQRGFTRFVVMAILAMLPIAACGLFGSVEPPIADCAGRVLADAAKGMTIVQIVEDVGGPCSLDAAQVMAAVLASQDPSVQKSKAYAEAIEARQLLTPKPGGG
jgi:predicted small lipoprotein YifL